MYEIQEAIQGSLCPCGKGENFENCCEPYLTGKKYAEDAVTLLRSRYTAFVAANIDYVLETHHPDTMESIDRESTEAWAKESAWLGLEILEESLPVESKDTHAIKFIAKYLEKGKFKHHDEIALFKKDHEQWKFYDAIEDKKEPYTNPHKDIGRNDPCHCGSGKKFKKCHGA